MKSSLPLSFRNSFALASAAATAAPLSPSPTVDPMLYALQTALLPDISSCAFSPWDLATFYASASEDAGIGGDFYDALRLPDGQVALIVGDVSGKGCTAAGRAAEARFALRALLRDPNRPRVGLDEVVAHLNTLLYQTYELDGYGGQAFVALTLAVVCPRTGLLRVVMAGGEKPLVVSADGSRIAPVGLPGTVLGVTRRASYELTLGRLAPGERLLLFTDGLTEARCPGGSFFGAKGVAQATARLLHGDAIPGKNDPLTDDADPPCAAALCRHIVDSALRHAGGALRDDLCLLALTYSV